MEGREDEAQRHRTRTASRKPQGELGTDVPPKEAALPAPAPQPSGLQNPEGMNF